MKLSVLVACSEAVAATRSRKAKITLISSLLRSAEPGEAGIAVSYLAGEPRQKRLGIAWSAFTGRWPPADQAQLSLSAVDQSLGEIEGVSGPGAVGERRERLGQLLARATASEQRFLVRLISGELRQGALQGVVAEAVAQAAGVSPPKLRRAAMLAGDLVEVAAAALSQGDPGLDRFLLRVGTPVQPMLAKSATSVAEALERAGAAAIEWKLDGVRIQLHRDRDLVSVFTRSLEPIGERLPEVIEAARGLPGERFILDGEVIALRENGRPRPFQETAARVAHRGDPGPLRDSVPLTAFFFDILHLDGEDLIDLPTRERIRIGACVVPPEMTVPRELDVTVAVASAFLKDTLARGHEGVMVKALDAPYLAGRRGAGGSRSSRGTPWTWWCWPRSGATAAARDFCPTSISGPGTPTASS